MRLIGWLLLERSGRSKRSGFGYYRIKLGDGNIFSIKPAYVGEILIAKGRENVRAIAVEWDCQGRDDTPV
jgi:hypothetical protein